MPSEILVVDDSAAIRKILQRVLRQTGLNITNILEAGDGQEALNVLEQNRGINVVLTDINMPNMDGIELLAALKRSPRWSRMPVLLVTTEGGEAKVGEAVRLGADG